jgi:hypothetical protein
MTDPKNQEELDKYKELSSSEEERLQDNQPSAAETTEEQKCPEGQVWNSETRQCEKPVDPDRDPNLASEIDTQTDLSSSEEERLQDNQPSAAEATEEQKCPKGQTWNDSIDKCVDDPQNGVPSI